MTIWGPFFMRRFASLGVVLLLSGCGYSTWWNPPFVNVSNSHLPRGDSENMRRAMGQTISPAPLQPEPGDIWPGPVKPEPTLQELEQSGSLTPGPEKPVVGSPMSLGAGPPAQAPSVPPQAAQGSSTPPPSNQAGVVQPPPAHAPRESAPAAPMPRQPGGQIVDTPSGPGVTTGGGAGYQTMTLPGGGSAIVVPNGNGTSTVIKPDGTMETIPTPK